MNHRILYEMNDVNNGQNDQFQFIQGKRVSNDQKIHDLFEMKLYLEETYFCLLIVKCSV